MRKFNLNRVGKYARYAYFAMASATLLAIPCFASTGVAEIDTPISNLLTMFFRAAESSRYICRLIWSCANRHGRI